MGYSFSEEITWEINPKNWPTFAIYQMSFYDAALVGEKVVVCLLHKGKKFEVQKLIKFQYENLLRVDKRNFFKSLSLLLFSLQDSFINLNNIEYPQIKVESSLKSKVTKFDEWCPFDSVRFSEKQILKNMIWTKKWGTKINDGCIWRFSNTTTNPFDQPVNFQETVLDQVIFYRNVCGIQSQRARKNIWEKASNQSCKRLCH